MKPGPLTIPLLLFVSGCSRAPSPPPPSARAEQHPEPARPTQGSAAAALDQLDTRAPLPLLPMMANHQKQNMREHLVVVQEILAALASDDFAAIERSVARIGFSEAMSQMCTHMGAGAQGFTEQALAFHRTADRISDAARGRDRARVLSELSTTLGTCTACHAAWKQRVVDEPTWRSLTSTAPPTQH